MRGHDQTSRRASTSGGAWFWCILVLVATLRVVVASAPLRAEEAPAPDQPVAAPATEPIDLVARQVQVWRSGDEQWVVLNGEAAVFQGETSLHAEQAVVHVMKLAVKSGTLYQIEVYAEGSVRLNGRAGGPERSTRVDFRSQREVAIDAYEPKDVVWLAEAPKGLALLDRALGTAPAPPPPPPAVVPKEVPAPPASVAVAPAPPVVLPPADRPLVRTQFDAEDAIGGNPVGLSPPVEAPVTGGAGATVPDLMGDDDDPGSNLSPLLGPGTALQPLPGPDGGVAAPLTAPVVPPGANPPGPEELPMMAPILPGTQRITRITPRNGGPDFSFQQLPTVDGVSTKVIRGGVQIYAEMPGSGILDIEADSAIVWTRVDKGKGPVAGPNGAEIQDASQPMEVYLEGNVILRQDARKVAGKADQKTFRAERAFYDFRSARFLGL